MGTESSISKKSVFGLLSIMAPLAGVGLGVIIVFIPDTDSGYMGLLRPLQCVGILIVSALIGGVSGIIGLVRGEPRIKLSFSGIVLSAVIGICVYLFIHANRAQ